MMSVLCIVTPPGRLTCVNFLLINVALNHVIHTLGAWCCALHSTQHSLFVSLFTRQLVGLYARSTLSVWRISKCQYVMLLECEIDIFLPLYLLCEPSYDAKRTNAICYSHKPECVTRKIVVRLLEKQCSLC